jgi:erythronate-4-phosphate dehydrogenase
MKIVCSSNMPYAREAFGTLGDVLVKDGRAISREDVRDAAILATRSTTRINAALLDGSSVRFAGTATIGTDHMDIDYLEAKDIAWCYSPGCNANSVSEYVTAALLCLAKRHGFALEGKTLGVVGVGNVGSRVVAKGEALGLRVLQNDPPRERLEYPDGDSPFVALDDLLHEADIVTLHVPLSREGADATYHMGDGRFFGLLGDGAVLLNCARGDVVQGDALLAAMNGGKVSYAVIDTWEGEPGCRADLLQRVDLGTPHIAGHSFEGKVMGTVMVYREACRFLGVEPAWSPDAFLPDPPVPRVSLDAADRPNGEILWDIVRRVYDIEADDARLRATVSQAPDERAARFDALRRNYPIRREFRFTDVDVNGATLSLEQALAGLGFGTGVSSL